MKKYLYALSSLILCFLLSSYSLIILSPFNKDTAANKLPSEAQQRLYAVIDAVENYSAAYINGTDQITSQLAKAFSSNMIIDYSQVESSINNGNNEIVINAKFLNPDKIVLRNNVEFEFSDYNNYIPNLIDSASNQINELYGDIELYTKEYQIRVSFVNANDYLKQKAILNQDDLDAIAADAMDKAEKIYSDYINTSDVSTASFCKSIKEMPLDNIADIYNENNEENQITDAVKIQLFKDFAKSYLDNMIINNIIQMSSNETSSKGTINYQIEKGVSTIHNTFAQLLDSYYVSKQIPVEKSRVIEDFGKELAVYNYGENPDLYYKSFEFTYSQNSNEFDINDDIYLELVNGIYAEFIKFDEILDEYYPQIQNKYFFVERPFASTTIILDNTGESRYRQLDINIKGSTDCYIKLYTYNTINDSIKELMVVAYIKKGDSLQVFIPEGDYIFKYATGEKWYGDIHMFSDEGQYFAGSNVISVHEYMMTTTIDLGDFDNGSIPAYSQTPDTF